MSFDDDEAHLLTVHGYVMGLRRVEGDDGDANQTLRWLIVDKEDQWWDVYRVHQENQHPFYKSRKMDTPSEEEQKLWGRDPMIGWKESFALCTESA